MVKLCSFTQCCPEDIYLKVCQNFSYKSSSCLDVASKNYMLATNQEDGILGSSLI